MPRQNSRTLGNSAEEYVGQLLLDRDDAFENHWLDVRERGEHLPRMRSVVRGQHRGVHGIDLLAIDEGGQLWIIEVSLGVRRGATRFKGGGQPVGYAGGGLQMSEDWRRAAALRFLDEPDALARIRVLLDLPEPVPEREVLIRFQHLLQRHRKAVIIPEGAHFDAVGTDVRFEREVFTHRFPVWLVPH